MTGDPKISDPKNENSSLSTKPKPHKCTRCGAEVGASIFLPKFGDQAAYNLFRCTVCGFTDWIKLSK